MMKTVHKIIAWLSIATLLMVALGVGVSFWAFRQVRETADARKHTFIVLNGADDLLSALKDAETSMRGYLLTGDEAFLEPYLEMRDRIRGQLEKLRQLTLIDAACKHLDAMVPLVDASLVHISNAIELYRKHDVAAAVDLVRSGAGKRLMDTIRAEIKSYIRIEEGALAQHDAEFQSDMRRMFILIAIASLFTLILALSFAYLIYRESQQRLKDLVHLETRHLLKIQEETNKQLQQANFTLQVSEEKLAVTLNSIGDAVIATDAEGRVILLNPLAEKLTGWTHAEAACCPIDNIFHIINQETRLPAIFPIMETLAHGTIHALSNHTILIARDGSERVIDDSCAPIRNSAGHVVGAVLVFRDVTERRQAEKTLEVNEEQLKIMFNEAPIGIALIDSVTGHVYEMNHMFAKIAGRTLEQMANIDWMSITHPDDVQKDLDNMALLNSGKIQGFRIEKRYLRPDGTAVWINMTITPLKVKDRVQPRHICMIDDISEHKRLEKALEELEATKKSADEASEFAESVINTVREPLISLDQDLRVVTVSRSFYDFFKVKPEETVGQLIYDLGNKQWDIPKLRELLETILPQEASFDNYEVEHDFATIGRRIMLLNARQIQRVLGKERIILLAIEDITDRKEIEHGLEKAHAELKELTTELKRTARVKSEFLANMSHELRTPLNSINGFSEVLSDETFGPLNEKQKKYINNVLTSGKHLLLLINQILDMAKVEAGKMQLDLSVLPMKNLLNEISLLVADTVSKKKLHMLLEIAEDLPSIKADELKVKQIIYNLLSNAVKFTPEEGNIGMRARKTDSEIEIEVWDTGVGIAAENMVKIFEGFFRVDTPYSRLTEGTGLGLPLSKKLVELHGGKFSVASKGLSKGTEVRFTLPIIFKEGGEI